MKLKIKIKILLYTTALVLEIPTSIAPPFVWYPKYDEIEVIKTANTIVLTIEYLT